MEAHPRALEAHPGALEAHPGALEPRLLTVETHPGEAHPGAFEAHPGAVKGPFFRHNTLGRENIIWPEYNFVSPCGETKNEAKIKYWIQGKKKQKESVLVLKNKANNYNTF